MMKWVASESMSGSNGGKSFELPPLAHLKDSDKPEYMRQVEVVHAVTVDVADVVVRSGPLSSLSLFFSTSLLAFFPPLLHLSSFLQVAEREKHLASEREALEIKQQLEAKRKEDRLAAAAAKKKAKDKADIIQQEGTAAAAAALAQAKASHSAFLAARDASSGSSSGGSGGSGTSDGSGSTSDSTRDRMEGSGGASLSHSEL